MSIISAALLLAFASDGSADSSVQGAAGEAKLKAWSASLGAGRVADAARMIGPTATYANDETRKKFTISSGEFVDKLAGCKPRFKSGPYINLTMPGKPATWAFHLLCAKFDSRAGGPEIGFFVSATATGVRVW